MSLREMEDNYYSDDYYDSDYKERFYAERIKRRNRKKARKKRLVTILVILAVIAVTLFSTKDAIRKAIETFHNPVVEPPVSTPSDTVSEPETIFPDVPGSAQYVEPSAVISDDQARENYAELPSVTTVEEDIALTLDGFDAGRRFYSRQLDSEEYRIYQNVEQAIRNAENTVEFKSSSVDRVLDIASYVYYDYPEYFWFDGSSSAQYQFYLNVYSGTLTLKYNCSPSDIPVRKQQIENALREIVPVLSDTSDYKKSVAHMNI